MKNSIVHIFSHQKHIMHVIVREVYIEGHYPNIVSSTDSNKSNREVKIMSLSEIEKAGLTTGMKKVLNAARDVLSSNNTSMTASSVAAVTKKKGGNSNHGGKKTTGKTSGKQQGDNNNNSNDKRNASGSSKSKNRSNDGNILNYFSK